MIGFKKLHFAFVIALLFVSFASVAVAGDKARLGFGTQATISGFFSPKLKRVTITEVQPNSPAAVAGLEVGDLIVEANDKVIAGAPAREMAGQLRNVKPGDHLRLRVKHSNQAFANIDIVAGAL